MHDKRTAFQSHQIIFWGNNKYIEDNKIFWWALSGLKSSGRKTGTLILMALQKLQCISKMANSLHHKEL